MKRYYVPEFERLDYNEMLDRILKLLQKYPARKFYIDGANIEFVRSLKDGIGEDSNYDRIKDRIRTARKNKLRPDVYMTVVPVSFTEEGTTLLMKSRKFIENTDRIIRIHPRFEKLIILLKTVMSNDIGHFDKTRTSYNDIFDAFRLAMSYFHYNSDY